MRLLALFTFFTFAGGRGGGLPEASPSSCESPRLPDAPRGCLPAPLPTLWMRKLSHRGRPGSVQPSVPPCTVWLRPGQGEEASYISAGGQEGREHRIGGPFRVMCPCVCQQHGVRGGGGEEGRANTPGPGVQHQARLGTRASACCDPARNWRCLCHSPTSGKEGAGPGGGGGGRRATCSPRPTLSSSSSRRPHRGGRWSSPHLRERTRTRANVTQRTESSHIPTGQNVLETSPLGGGWGGCFSNILPSFCLRVCACRPSV